MEESAIFTSLRLTSGDIVAQVSTTGAITPPIPASLLLTQRGVDGPINEN